MLSAKDAQVLYELGTMRFIARSWSQFYGPNVANVAEHTLRVAWISMLLCAAEKVDPAAALQMALVHDVGEVRSGDSSKLNHKYTERQEAAAVQDTFAGSLLSGQMPKLWQEFDDGKSIAAQIVHDADKLDSILELREQTGRWAFSEMANFQDVSAEDQFCTKSAKNLYRQLARVSPHEWYGAIYRQMA